MLESPKSVFLFEIGGHLCTFFVAGLLTSLPVIGNTYGKSGEWCWINSKTEMGIIWIYTAFYGPLWFAILVIISLYLAVLVKVYQNFKKGKS